MTKNCSVEPAALYKILLHSLKHTAGVNGVLLGTVSVGTATGAGPATAVRVVDAVPVGHGFVTLTPVLEMALSQIEGYVHEQAGSTCPLGLRIVGYYQCNERLGDSELGGGRRVADRIEAAFPDSVAVVLDSTVMDTALQAAVAQQQQDQAGKQQVEEEPVLALFVKDGMRGWVRASASDGKTRLHCPTQGVAAQLAQYAAEGRHRALVDFEQHLDDINANWLNTGLLEGPA
ncbi:hypothetical protein CHLNCDRAFT_58988 [Chlorella variabilis]|uniref:MPN domain-containing protein n=1 Tax=Chlorella variabilis TaxID=554065 RepID=E1ZPZ1_CHLVA|nr:hypothetical protein CHLNCDRAFT_58988 [Chlorella variabilis]EFN52064.1 hypothetical protein CHLNCDRAFT_58988 [Chlorella variabilis]|eukprot:XP_005844166.1 hypothetical protein CHLNCDRAFT_58988 [Chlorella variabilis]